MSRPVLRAASPQDVRALSELGRETFAGTFQSLYSPENLAQFLGEFHSVAYYNTALHNPEVRIWVIEDAGDLVAYTKVGPHDLPCDPPHPDALELSRLYVRDGYQGRGLGAKLMDEVIAFARDSQRPSIVLSVYADNLAAQKFYRRYGFEKIGDYFFHVGNHQDPEFIFFKSLSLDTEG